MIAFLKKKKIFYFAQEMIYNQHKPLYRAVAQ